MQNIRNDTPTPDAAPLRRFVDDFAGMLASFGLSLTPGRTFAYLLVKSRPVNLDEVSDFLGISKSGISVAARTLETIGLARRIPQAGSRRILYEVQDRVDAMIQNRVRANRIFLARLADAQKLAEDGRARQRIADLIDLYTFLTEESLAIVAAWEERKKGNGRGD